MLSAMHTRAQLAADDGGVLVIVAVSLSTLILFAAFVIDIGNWFEHKRHLQLQADAGALAGGGLFTRCITDNVATATTAIEAEARRYAGSYPGAYNEQVGGSNRGTVYTRLNRKTYEVGGPSADDTIETNPCDAGMLDVKMTEAGLPFFFGLAGSLVPAINARARVNIEKLTTTHGALPIGVPDVNPVAARAWFIDESNGGAVLGSAPLVKSATPSAAGLTVWKTDPLVPVAISVSSTTTKIGLRVALSGSASTTTCGDPLVECYDQTDPATGLDYVRTWAATPAAASPPGAPIARSVTLFSPGGACADPYFHSDVTPCNQVGVRARIDYGSLDRTKLKIFVDSPSCSGANCKEELTYDAANPGDWVSVTSKAFVPTTANGPQPITMSWQIKDNITINGNGCNTGQGCSGTFEGGSLVQRSFGATDARSGPIKLVQVSQGATTWVNSLQRPAAGNPAVSYNLDISVGIKASLGAAAAASDPPVALKVIGGSQSQALNCDQGYTTLSDELANGCRETYTINTTGCLAPVDISNKTKLWASAQPWSCVAIATGQQTNQVPAGLNMRILGNDKPTVCTAPNNWSSFPNLPQGDPRILQVFLTPFGAFSGSGNDETVRVTDFATFYITGWTGSGSGFPNPCEGNGDDPVPNGDKGTIVGHFIIYIDKLNPGGGSGVTCSFTSLGTCVLVLTK
jgi:hypothetical protein